MPRRGTLAKMSPSRKKHAFLHFLSFTAKKNDTPSLHFLSFTAKKMTRQAGK
jgi:hypothetical protein